MEEVSKKCVSCGQRVSLLILAINIVSLVIKWYLARISYSDALLADAFESLNNIIITFIALFSLWLAEKKPDDKFPYGYGKIEFIASGLTNFILAMAASVFIFVSIKMTILYSEIVPRPIAILGAVLGFALNQIAYIIGKCPGEKLKSPIILANARANKLDAYTSIAVVAAVIVSNLGVARLDHLVGVLIGLLILHETIEGMIYSIKELMGHAYKEQEQSIRTFVDRQEGINRMNCIKTRSIGRKIWVDMDLVLDREKTVSEGLCLVEKIKAGIFNKIPNIAELSIQLLPEKRV